ncbi:hypothetical protein GGR53DRAFT_96820 [Hypoxylon sp. FL1150]|nr:hypothetical protein GGR53DRAFT_96820 [Hypoxylon sp. FL1150]
MEWTTDQRTSTYRQYKEDTETIAGWLAHQSRKCGYQPPEAPPAVPDKPPSSRLKGKARKQARNAAVKPTTTQMQSKPKYSVNVADFNRMAQAIADFTPKVTIPTALDNLFSRAIDARNRFTEWYRQSSHGEEGSNRRHAHFTGVLNSAWEVLRPFQSTRPSRVKKQPADILKPEPVANLTNRFSKLEVEQPHEDLDTATLSTAQDEDDYKLPGVTPATIIKNEEDIEEDFLFAIFTFMQELAEVRAYVGKVWECYRQGTLELIVCSLLTNTAIQLVRRAEHELDLLVRRPKKYPASRYPSGSFPDIFVYANHEYELKMVGTELDDFLKPSKEYHIVDHHHGVLCLSEIFGALKHYLYEVKVRGGKNFVPMTSRRWLNTPETFDRVRDMVACFQGITRTIGDSFARDEFTSGIELMIDSNTIPIWVAFAMRVLLDIQDELKATPERAVQEVQRHARRRLAAFRCIDFNRDPFAAAEGNEWLAKTLGDYERDVLGDHFRHMLSRVAFTDGAGQPIRQADMDPIRARLVFPIFMTEPNYFLRINPVKCGMLKYGMYLQAHNYGTKIEDDWRGVTATIHLYIACRSIFPDDPVWPDMEYFLKFQDLDNLFVGGLPGSMVEAYKKASLAMGQSLVSYARGASARGGRPSSPRDLNWEKGRRVTNPCLLDDVYASWMCGGTDMTDDMISNLVNVIYGPKSRMVAARDPRASKSTLKSEDARPKVDYSKISILGKLGAEITCETYNLYFDWISFMETCQSIWEQIHLVIKLETEWGRPTSFLLQGPLLQILEVAAKWERMAEAKKLDATSVLRERATGLVRSWEIIQMFNRRPLQVPSGNGGSVRTGEKIWGGDNEIFNVVSRATDESKYPTLPPNLVQDIYKNWPKQDIDSSATIRKNLAEGPGVGWEFARQEPQDTDGPADATGA